MTTSTPFSQRGCALVTLSTGVRAQSLKELRAAISDISEQCLHYHFLGRLLRPQFGEMEFTNDFAAWVHGAIGDAPTAERLNILNPFDFPTFEDLRTEIAELLDNRLAREDFLSWARADFEFFFTEAAMIAFDTGRSADSRKDLAQLVSESSRGSVFYHFVDARRRTPGHVDDYSAWLEGIGGDDGVIRRIRALDPYFLSLGDLRSQISHILHEEEEAA